MENNNGTGVAIKTGALIASAIIGVNTLSGCASSIKNPNLVSANETQTNQDENKPVSEYGNRDFQKLTKEAFAKKSNIMVPLDTFNKKIETDTKFGQGSIVKLPNALVTVTEGPIGVGVVDENGFYHEITRTSGVNVFIQSVDSSKKSVNVGIQNLGPDDITIREQDSFNHAKLPPRTSVNVFDLGNRDAPFQVSYNKL